MYQHVAARSSREHHRPFAGRARGLVRVGRIAPRRCRPQSSCLSGAEYRDHARSAMRSPAGVRCRFSTWTSGENAPFDALFRLSGSTAAADRLGHWRRACPTGGLDRFAGGLPARPCSPSEPRICDTRTGRHASVTGRPTCGPACSAFTARSARRGRRTCCRDWPRRCTGPDRSDPPRSRSRCAVLRPTVPETGSVAGPFPASGALCRPARLSDLFH